MAEEISMEEEIRAALKGETVDVTLETPVEVVDDVADDGDPAAELSSYRDEKGRFKAKESAPVEEVKSESAPVQSNPQDQPPAALSAAVKAKWATLDPEVKAEIVKREADVHKMFTAHDGELNLGRKMKEVVTPYMPIITAEGGTPETAVRDLLNTAYLLRTAQPVQKAQLVQQVIQQFGVDMSLLGEPQDGGQYSEVAALRQQLEQIKQQVDPNAQYQALQERLEHDRVMSEVNAFAADVKNVHYQAVKPEMAALLGSGQAKTLQEAYDMACWAKPDIRSTLLAAQNAAEAAKRKAELDAKRKAASSVTGSSGAPPRSNSAGKSSDSSIEDDLREAMEAFSG